MLLGFLRLKHYWNNPIKTPDMEKIESWTDRMKEGKIYILLSLQVSHPTSLVWYFLNPPSSSHLRLCPQRVANTCSSNLLFFPHRHHHR